MTTYAAMTPAADSLKRALFGIAIALALLCPSAGGAFNLTQPGDLKTDIPVGVTFEWEAQTDATSYHIECDDDTSFSSPAFTGTTTNTLFQPACGSLRPGICYYWRVTALLVGGGQVTTNPSRFKSDEAKGKLSKNFYRLPYTEGEEIRGSDYITHMGAFDLRAYDAPANLIAIADGWVIWMKDDCDACGGGHYRPPNNGIAIRHVNGEMSGHAHIAQGSIPAGVQLGDWVTAGQVIATEGDVGNTRGGDSACESLPRSDTCVSGLGRCCIAGACSIKTPAVCEEQNGTYIGGSTCSSPADECGDIRRCGRHCHFGVSRQTTDDQLNPIFCDVAGNIFVDNRVDDNCQPFEDPPTYTPGECLGGCPDAVGISGESYCGFGQFRVLQANDTITVSNYVLRHLAGHVFHAGAKVRLLPGFHADADSYFRAEIGACNTTSASAPASAPTDEPGACCDGACVLRAELDCYAARGDFKGAGTTCESDTCESFLCPWE